MEASLSLSARVLSLALESVHVLLARQVRGNGLPRVDYFEKREEGGGRKHVVPA